MYQNKDKEAKAARQAGNAMADFKSGAQEAKNAKDTLLDGAGAEETSRNLREIAHDAGERFQHFISGKKDQAHDAKVSAERAIRANPLAAAAAAFAGGVLLSRLLRRK